MTAAARWPVPKRPSNNQFCPAECDRPDEILDLIVVMLMSASSMKRVSAAQRLTL